jgi:hypothetical protein
MNLHWLKNLWANEPVIVRGLLAVAVDAGVLSATQASAVGNAVAAVVAAAALLSARGKVTPTSKRKA